MLLQNKSYHSVHEKVETKGVLLNLLKKETPDIVIHLAAQAGVRYSIKNPRAHTLKAIFKEPFELLEAACIPPAHMLLASTSSVYGANKAFLAKRMKKLIINYHFMQRLKNL